MSMSPFVIARAHQVIEQARESLRAEAIQHVEAERGIARNESLAFAEQVHSEASRVVGESQSQVVQSQRGLNEIRGGFTSCQMAHREIESIRLQSRAEVLRIQKDAQSHVSHV